MTAPEGTLSRIVCDPELDAPPVPIVTTAAMFAGETVYKASTTTGMPFIALGLNDFSMEWFVKGRTAGSFNGGDGSAINSGLVTPTVSDTVGAIQVGMTVDDASVSNLQVDMEPGVAGGVTIVIGNTTWSHVVMSVDRTGLATFYLDGSVDSTRDASAGSGIDLLAVPVHPLLGSILSLGAYDNVITDDHDDVDSAQCYLSSFAIHNRQLTPSEVSANFAAKVVGNFVGSTFVRYLFSRFVDSGGAPVTVSKETTPANISLGCKDRIAEPQNSELFAPIAASGTLFIEDTSGNGGHWPLFTLSSYGSGSLAARAGNGFATTGAS